MKFAIRTVVTIMLTLMILTSATAFAYGNNGNDHRGLPGGQTYDGNTGAIYDHGVATGQIFSMYQEHDDIGGSGGGGSTPAAVDLTIAAITPTAYRPHTTALSAVKVKNTSTAAQSNVRVDFSAGGANQIKTINIPAGQTVLVLFKWTTGATGSITLIGKVNDTKTITETNYSNNTLSTTATIKSPFDNATEQENPVPLVPLPNGDNNNHVTWDDGGSSYWAHLDISAIVAPTSMKSGYGFEAKVTTVMTTNYSKPSELVPPQSVYMFVPEWQYSKVVELMPDGVAAYTTVWRLPMNPYSVIGAKKWYVPVWFPDQMNYSVNFTAYNAYTPGGELTATTKAHIVINGNMYQDDSVNNAWTR